VLALATVAGLTFYAYSSALRGAEDQTRGEALLSEKSQQQVALKVGKDDYPVLQLNGSAILVYALVPSPRVEVKPLNITVAGDALLNLTSLFGFCPSTVYLVTSLGNVIRVNGSASGVYLYPTQASPGEKVLIWVHNGEHPLYEVFWSGRAIAYGSSPSSFQVTVPSVKAGDLVAALVVWYSAELQPEGKAVAYLNVEAPPGNGGSSGGQPSTTASGYNSGSGNETKASSTSTSTTPATTNATIITTGTSATTGSTATTTTTTTATTSASGSDRSGQSSEGTTVGVSKNGGSLTSPTTGAGSSSGQLTWVSVVGLPPGASAEVVYPGGSAWLQDFQAVQLEAQAVRALPVEVGGTYYSPTATRQGEALVFSYSPTQFWVETGTYPEGAGTARPNSGWYLAGSELQFSALAGKDWEFLCWRGYGSGSYTGTSREFQLEITGPTQELALFKTYAVKGVKEA